MLKIGANCPSIAPTWANIAPTWAQLGPNLAQLGPTWAQLGRPDPPTWSQDPPTWSQDCLQNCSTWVPNPFHIHSQSKLDYYLRSLAKIYKKPSKNFGFCIVLVHLQHSTIANFGCNLDNSSLFDTHSCECLLG